MPRSQPANTAEAFVQKSEAWTARSTLREAILKGVYQPGELLPSSRELASRFRVNRNTVYKIYRELAAEGLVEARRQGPPRVVVSAVVAPEASLQSRLRHALWPLLHEGRLRRMEESELRSAVQGAVQEFFERYRPVRVLVAECNPLDAQKYTQQLATALDCVVTPVLLQELSDCTSADLVVTPWFHISEARAAMADREAGVERFLVTPVGEDVMTAVSRVNLGPVGVVAGNEAAAERLMSLLRFYLDTAFLVATSGDRQRIARIVKEAEIVICSARCRAEIDELGGSEKSVTIRYGIDPASVEALRLRVAEIAASR